jgi:hypothetical protein
MPARVPSQGRQVHMAADTDAIENVTFIQCPPERHVRVNVPLKVCCGRQTGDLTLAPTQAAPLGRLGGWMRVPVLPGGVQLASHLNTALLTYSIALLFCRRR